MGRKRKAGSLHSSSAADTHRTSSSKTKAVKHDNKPLDWSTIKTPVNWKIQPLKPSHVPRQSGPPTKRRRIDQGGDDHSPNYDPNDDAAETKKYQPSPFEGTNVGEAYYQIKPSRIWLGMARYSKFSIQSDAFAIGDFVYVKSLDTEQEDDDSGPEDPMAHAEKRWIAKVLEVRATDEKHVFLRIYWMYRPEDLPTGRLPYHGTNELIASNHMDIIDAATVDGKASVVYWQEDSDSDEPLNPLVFFWRQTFDVHQNKHGLSHLPLHCVDKKEYNPNELLIQCDNCKAWLHNKCLEKEAIRELYEKNNLKYTETSSKPQRGRPRLKSRSGTDDLLFSAHLDLGENDDKLSLTITDHRPDHIPATWVLPTITCLLCRKPVEDAAAKHEDDHDVRNASSSRRNKPAEPLHLRSNSPKQTLKPGKPPTPSPQPGDHAGSPPTPSKSESIPDAHSSTAFDDKDVHSDVDGTKELAERSEETGKEEDEEVEKG